MKIDHIGVRMISKKRPKNSKPLRCYGAHNLRVNPTEKICETEKGSTLMQAIDDECDGDTRRGYQAIVRMACDPCWYFTRNIYKAMKGLGTDDDALVRNIVFTSEVRFPFRKNSSS